MTINIALSGATGNLGPAILSALLGAGFYVTILTRKDSTSTDSLPSHPNQKIVSVDYASPESLRSALKGNEVFISVVDGHAVETQKAMTDAALAAGVRRFIPSEFGSDTNNPKNRALPVFEPKVQVRKYLENLTRQHPDFTYTYVINNAFFDWGLRIGFVANLKKHEITLFDGGDHPISFTTLATIGKAVVGIVKNQAATRNRTVYIHDVAFSQNQLIEFVKKIDGKQWVTAEKNTGDLYNAALEELKKPEPDYRFANVNQVFGAAFGKANNPDFTGRADNELFGIAENDMKYLESVVRGLLA